MLISNAQLSGIESSSESRFASSLLAQQVKSFPQLGGTPSATLAAQTAASLAVAQFHGFSKQNDLASCATTLAPFLAGAANAGGAQGADAKALQTMVADAKSVLSKLNVPANAPDPNGAQIAALVKGCAPLAAATGSTPLNADRSGPVIPADAPPLLKAGDLVAPACSALPPAKKAANGDVTQEQMEAAADVAQNFPNTVLGSVTQNCKQLVDLEFRRVYWDGTPIPNIPYTVTLSDGSTRSGTTDANGLGAHSSVPTGYAKVVYGENKNPAKGSVSMDVDPDFQHFFSIASS